MRVSSVFGGLTLPGDDDLLSGEFDLPRRRGPEKGQISPCHSAYSPLIITMRKNGNTVESVLTGKPSTARIKVRRVGHIRVAKMGN